MLFPHQLPPRLNPQPSYRLYVFCAPLVRAAFAGLSECDLLHKQVTLLSNGLLCHSRTPPWRFLSPHPHTHTHTYRRFLPDDYGDEWARQSAVWPPAALHKTTNHQADFLLDGTVRVMEESDASWGSINVKSTQKKPLGVITTHNSLQEIPRGPHLILSFGR